MLGPGGIGLGCLPQFAAAGLFEHAKHVRQDHGIWPSAGTADRWIDQNDAFQHVAIKARRANGDARTHRMTEQDVLFQAELLGESVYVGGIGIETVVESVAGLRQSTAAHADTVWVECLGQALAY